MHRKVARMLSKEWRDTAMWPVPPEKAIRPEYKDSYERRKHAIEAYVRGDPLKNICKDEGLDSAALYALFEACIRRDADGSIRGYRALIPYVRNKRYERSAPMVENEVIAGRGTSGLFSALLAQHQDLQEFIQIQAKKYIGAEWLDRRIPVRIEHGKFLSRLAKKIPLSSYPFNVTNKGREGYRQALHATINTQRGRLSSTYKSSQSRAFLSDNSEPYRNIQIDAHRLDASVPVKFIGRKNRSRVKQIRPWLIAAVECDSTAVLGWHLSVEKEPSEFDVLSCLYKMMLPWKPRTIFAIDELAYKEGGGMPSGLIEHCRCRYGDCYELDNALGHHADNLRAVVLKKLHASLKLGKPGEPRTRSEIEQIFNTLTHRNIQWLVGGIRPDMSNRERKAAFKAAEKDGMTVEQMEEYLDVVFCDYNVHPSGAIYSKSPLQHLADEVDNALIRQDESVTASWRNLLQIEMEKTVCASSGHPPHINYEGATYTNDVLRVGQHLVGDKVIITVNLADLKTCEAHLVNGTELGTLVADSRWQFTHDYRLRKKLNAAINDGRFFWVPDKNREEQVKKFLTSQGRRRNFASRTQSEKERSAKASVPHPVRIIADVAVGQEFDLEKLLGKRLKG